MVSITDLENARNARESAPNLVTFIVESADFTPSAGPVGWLSVRPGEQGEIGQCRLTTRVARVRRGRRFREGDALELRTIYVDGAVDFPIGGILAFQPRRVIAAAGHGTAWISEDGRQIAFDLQPGPPPGLLQRWFGKRR